MLYSTVKVPKNASENVDLLKLSAAYIYLEYLSIKANSMDPDLGLHCLLKRLLKHFNRQ